MLVAITAAGRGRRALAAPRLEAATLWCAAGLAILAATAAVSAGASSLNLDYIVQAQRHTALFVLTQPAAASIYIVALALAGQDDVLRDVLAAPRRRAVALLALAGWSALGALLFLGGYAGRGLPGPVWLLLKTLAVAALLLVARRRLSGLAPGPRLAIAWAGCLLGFVNLAISLVLAPR